MLSASRVYSAEFENQSITNAGGDRDFWYLAPADDKPCWLIGWNLDQISDVKDAEEEILRYRVIRGHTTVGTGGGSVTPTPLAPSDAAAGATVRANDTTIASAGTPVNIASYAFNIRMGERIWLPPELWIPITQAQTSIVLRLMAGPADDVTLSSTLWFAEQG
jgi:hypothetical protein